MSWVAAAVVGGSIASGYLTGKSQEKAAEKAAGAQMRASEAGIDEERRQFDKLQELLSPYVQAGDTALTQQLALIGLGGEKAQKDAISALEKSPQFEALTRQGEEAILQRASATGGLRGGNVQSALSQYRPQILSGLIESQYGKLGQIVGQGQASAAGVGAAGQQTGQNIANLLQQQGAASAGAAMAGAAPMMGAFQGGLTGLGLYAGLGGFSGNQKKF